MIPSRLFQRERELPLLNQASSGECGLVCLAMIAAYHGQWVELSELRQKHAISARGTSLRSILRVADALGFSGRAVRLEIEDLDKLATPCILHWELSHFVVLKTVRSGKLVVHDPAAGIRTLTKEEVGRKFTGVAVELTPAVGFQKAEKPPPLRISDLWTRSESVRRSIFEVLALSTLLLVTNLLLPLYLQLAIDGATVGDSNFLATLAFGFAAVLLFSVAAEALRAWAIIYLGSLMSFQMVGNVFRHLLRLPLPFFEGRHVGDLMSRLSSTQQVRDALTTGFVAALIDGSMSIVTGFILFAYNAPLAWAVLSSVVAYAVAVSAVVPRLREAQERELVARAKEQSHVIETLDTIRTLRLFGAEQLREASWRNVYASALNKSVVAGRLQLALLSARTLIFGLQLIVVVYLGVLGVMTGDLTIGALVAFMAYRTNFSDRMASFLEQIVQFRLLELHLDRLSDIVRTRADASYERPEQPGGDGSIELSGVEFRYSESEPWVLNGASARIAPREYVAIVGPSGAGKTTLLKLMLGLYAPTNGEMRIHGMPIGSLAADWRTTTSVVMQDDHLLAGTIAENIAFFDPDFDMAKVEEAAKRAFIHDDILQSPLGYLSLVGEMGLAFSAGQRQRILLARAFYREPSILFLDEGTANLDEATEKLVANSIEALDATRVIVSHRPELVRRAHRVLKLEDGKLVATTNDRLSELRLDVGG